MNLVLLSALKYNVLATIVLLSLGSRAWTDEQKTVAPSTLAEVNEVLRQLRGNLPNKSDDEIIELLRSYVPPAQAKNDDRMSWLCQRLQLAKQQKAAVMTIRRSAGLVFYDYQISQPGTVQPHAQLEIPQTLVGLLGEDFFADAIEASLGNGGIEQVGKLTKLRRLNVSYLIGDIDLVHLNGLSELRWLDLGGIPITDDGLQHIKPLKRLEYLGVWNTNMTDVGLRHLKALTHLRQLNLSNTRIGDVSIQYLSGLAQLQELDLSGTGVTEGGMKRLQQALPKCKIAWKPKGN